MNETEEQGHFEVAGALIDIRDVLYCPYPECGSKGYLHRFEFEDGVDYFVQCTNADCMQAGRKSETIKGAVRNWCRLSVDEPVGWRFFFKVLGRVLFGRGGARHEQDY